MENKRGFETSGLIVIIFASLFILLILAIISFSAGKTDTILSQLTGTIGNMSLNDTYQQMVHPTIVTIQTTIPKTASILLILGMFICLFLVGTKVPSKSNLWIILDIVILIVVEVFAVMISLSFKNSLLNLSPEFFTIFSTTLSEASKFVLNLPTIIPIMGVLVMVATYILRRENVEEQQDNRTSDFIGGFE